MSDPAVLTAVEAGVMTITLNRPEVLNALNPALLDGLGSALAAAKRDPQVRAVILTGAGRGFCAGADLAAPTLREGPDDVEQALRDRYHPIVLALYRLPKPVVAAVNGPAAGAGMSLALACDIVLAAESATFLQAFTRIGLVPDCGSTWLLPRRVGDARARALVMLAERISAEQAQQHGLVWSVHPDAHLTEAALGCARRLAQMPTRALALAKQALDVSPANGLAEQLEVEGRLQAECIRTEDFREGVAAFVEKRPARFKGR
jgi:2-(1,2-epoxy-1,2-dihydrophenyl)acetyl-CoA isomerase